MNVKKSFFNRTIFLKNIGLFWPVCVLYLLVLFYALGTVVPRTEYGIYTTVGRNLFHVILSSGPCLLYISLIFAAVFAGISFRYVFFRKSSDTIHALPVTRTCLFISNAASGLLMLLLPQIIYFIILKLMTGDLGLGKIPWEYWGFSLAMLGCSLFFYALALVCIMVSGHLIAFPVLYLLLNIIAASISKILQLFLQLLAFGFDLTSFSFNLSFLSPRAYISNKINFLLGYNSYDTLVDSSQATGFYLTVLWYVLAAVILSLLTLFLYHKRKAEKCGTPITFSSLSYVVKLILPLYAALCITYFFYTTFNASYVYYKPEDTLLLLVIFIVSSSVCSLLTEMLLRKSFRISKKGLLGSFAFTVFVLICGFVIRLDAFGITSRLPDVADITKVSFTGSSSTAMSSLITDPKKIQEVIDMNRQIIHEKDNIIRECNKMYEQSNSDSFSTVNGDSIYGGYSYNANGYLYTVRINYLLKSKKTVTRTYTLPVFPIKMDNTDSYAAKLQEFVSNPEYILAAMHQLEEKNNSFNSISLYAYKGTLLQMLGDIPVSDDDTFVYQVNDNPYSNNTNSCNIDGSDIENIQKMYQAIQKDIKNGTLKSIQSLDFRTVREYFQVDVTYMLPSKGTIGSEVIPSEYGNPLSYIATKDCKNILAVYQDILMSNHDETSSSEVATEARRLCETYGYHISRYDYMDTLKPEAKIFSSIQEACIQGGYPAMTSTEGNAIYRYNYELKETHNGAVSLCILTDTMLGTGEYIYKDKEAVEEINPEDPSLETYIEADVQILGSYLYYSGDVTPIKAVSDTAELTAYTDPILDLEVNP